MRYYLTTIFSKNVINVKMMQVWGQPVYTERPYFKSKELIERSNSYYVCSQTKSHRSSSSDCSHLFLTAVIYFSGDWKIGYQSVIRGNWWVAELLLVENIAFFCPYQDWKGWSVSVYICICVLHVEMHVFTCVQVHICVCSWMYEQVCMEINTHIQKVQTC